jgi:hypothetical protein
MLSSATISSLCPGGEEKPIQGGQLQREEQHFSRARACLDRVGKIDDMYEGFFACLKLIVILYVKLRHAWPVPRLYYVY